MLFKASALLVCKLFPLVFSTISFNKKGVNSFICVLFDFHCKLTKTPVKTCHQNWFIGYIRIIKRFDFI